MSFLTDNRYLSDMPPGRLLDVGCGTGAYVAWMAREGWDAHGIDFDADAVATARRYPGVDARVGDLASQKYPDDHFDAVVLSNVIEHLLDPQGVFDECRRILAPGGRLVMITPNVDALGHKLFGPDWRGLEPPRHLFLFPGDVLEKMGRKAGFKKVDVFSSPGSRSAAEYVLDQSTKVAQANGRAAPRVSAGQIALQERALDLLGLKRGEWVVLVATK
ncbi:MAG: methyltransferase domain-containing protein [Phenylobacterium sp.]|uniref:class I SAM-dependent methyltransferase n=1 Tax=Phenylobacterium sp. TaxID=1871053 RepID=UPI0025F52CE6|nr:class I SAM-dependent methyltransferase [Phenylobacterium sp.]MBI1198420.1 methyltransferase domain-containing protein [Phenylobacterium sp.]